MEEIIIHRLGLANADILHTVADGVFDHPVRADYSAAFIAADNHHMVVAVINGQVVGMASGVVYYHPDKPAQFWINEVGTGDDWIGKGIATKVMNEILQVAKDCGCGFVSLATEDDNLSARALYRKVGGDEETGVVTFGWDWDEA